MKSGFVVTAGLLALCLGASARASVTVKAYQDAKKDTSTAWQLVRMYVSGVGMGLVYANEEVKMKKRHPLFCPPATVSFNQQNMLEMLDEDLATARHSDDDPIEDALLEGLEKAFPCG